MSKKEKLFTFWAEQGDIGSISPCGNYVKFRAVNGDAEVIPYDREVVSFEGKDFIFNGQEWVEFNPNSFVGF